MEKILGQQRAMDMLLTAVRGERAHHAYIFHGPVGVGKATTARAFAQLLLCHQPQTDLTGQIHACGSCEACRLAESGNHPDLHIIVKELAGDSSIKQLRTRKQMNIPVDLLRERIIGGKAGAEGKFYEPIAYKTAALNHNKVFIIDEAELLEPIGQNALLKTLEEPPGGTYFILVTSNEERLLPTVRSRCQRIPFAPLPDSVVDDWLGRQEKSLRSDLKQWLIGFVEGSLGRAALILAYDLELWAEVIRPAMADMPRGRFDVQLGSQIATMMNDFAERWVKDHANASKDAANKQAVLLMWSMIAHEARLAMRQAAEWCDPGDPDAADARMQPWLGVIEALNVGHQQINSNVNVAMVCDNVISRIHRLLSGQMSMA